MEVITLSNLVIASNEAEVATAAAAQQHHAELIGALAVATDRLLTAAGRGAADSPRADLLQWCRTQLVPHLHAEEQTWYRAGQGEDAGRLLVAGLRAEHERITQLISDLDAATEPVRAAAAARALQVLVDCHATELTELLLPLLMATPAVSLTELSSGRPELLGHPEQPVDDPATSPSHRCACGENEETGLPELDVRAVPHAIRHATVFGALDAIQPGKGLVLVAPHDPLPLLAQLERRAPDSFEVSYRERGPQTWRLLLLRRAA